MGDEKGNGQRETGHAAPFAGTGSPVQARGASTQRIDAGDLGGVSVAFRRPLWRCANRMDSLTALGLTAATLTTCSFVPQLTKVWRSKSAADLSYGMFGAFSVGILLWFFYGVLRDDLPVIVANGVTLVLSVTILALKIRYDR